MDRHDEAASPSDPANPLGQIVPGLLIAAVVGLAGLFMQVAKLSSRTTKNTTTTPKNASTISKIVSAKSKSK
jgi:hypothetical protein